METYGLGLLDRYPDAWKVFLILFLLTNIFTGLFYVLAKKRGWMPAIRSRDVHTTRKPRVGGLGMWAAALIGLVSVALYRSDLLDFTAAGAVNSSHILFGIIAGMAVVLGFGILDDLVGLPPWGQLVGQFLAATALILAGLQVSYLRLPFDHVIWMDRLIWHIGPYSILPLSSLFIYFWVITMINVMNFFDGLDGLAGSVAMTASVVMLLVSLRLGFIGAATLCLIIFGITAGFLPWNWHPSKLFMGTVGSQLLGFMLGVVAIISGAKVATAVLVLGIPVFDAVIVIIRRLIAHERPWQADQRHLHHRLLKIGLSTPAVVIITNVVAVVFGILGLSSQQSSQKGLLTILLLLCMIGFIIITYVLERKATEEVD